MINKGFETKLKGTYAMAQYLTFCPSNLTKGKAGFDSFGSVAERVKALFLRQPLSHDLGSARTLVTLLRPWIRHFTMIISAEWLPTQAANFSFKRKLDT